MLEEQFSQNHEEYNIVEISEEHLSSIATFSCSEEPGVELFLKDEALGLHKSRNVRTRLVFDANQNLVGFFSLFNESVEVRRPKREKHDWHFETPASVITFPAIRIHYMGVTDSKRRQGIGTYMLMKIFDLAIECSLIAGCNFLTAEALNSAVPFYEEMEFIRIATPTAKYKLMVYNLQELMD